MKNTLPDSMCFTCSICGEKLWKGEIDSYLYEDKKCKEICMVCARKRPINDNNYHRFAGPPRTNNIEKDIKNIIRKYRNWDKILRDEFLKQLPTPPPERRRILNATWSLDIEQDLKTLHDVDTDDEVVKAMANEIDQEILKSITKKIEK